MRIRKTIAIGSIAALASLGLASPAWAAGSPPSACPTTGQGPNGQSGTPEGQCPVTGNLSIGSVWAIGTDFQSFSVSTTGSNSTSAGDVYVDSNNSTAGGYTITETSTAFTSGSLTPIPASDVNAGAYFTSSQGSFTTPIYEPLGQFSDNAFAVTAGGITGGVNYGGDTPIAGWDGYAVPGYYLNANPGAFASGAYSATIDFDLYMN